MTIIFLGFVSIVCIAAIVVGIPLSVEGWRKVDGGMFLIGLVFGIAGFASIIPVTFDRVEVPVGTEATYKNFFTGYHQETLKGGQPHWIWWFNKIDKTFSMYDRKHCQNLYGTLAGNDASMTQVKSRACIVYKPASGYGAKIAHIADNLGDYLWTVLEPELSALYAANVKKHPYPELIRNPNALKVLSDEINRKIINETTAFTKVNPLIQNAHFILEDVRLRDEKLAAAIDAQIAMEQANIIQQKAKKLVQKERVPVEQNRATADAKYLEIIRKSRPDMTEQQAMNMFIASGCRDDINKCNVNIFMGLDGIPIKMQK